MSLTAIIQSNSKKHSVFNPIWFAYESTNKNQDQFRYVFDIYSGETTSTHFLQRYLVPPRPVDGYGVIDVQKYVQANMSYSLSATSLGYIPASGHYLTYTIQVGESTPYWEFFDNYFGWSAGTGFVGFSGATEHNLQAGDKIVVQQDQPYTNESYQGEHQVLYVQSPYIVVTSTAWGQSTTPEGGRIYKSNGSPFLITGITATENNAFLTALTRKEFSNLNPLFSYTTGSGQFLTNSPSVMNMMRDNYALVSQFNLGSNYFLYVDTYDQNDSLLGRYRFANGYAPATKDEEEILHFGIGVKNLSQTPSSLYSVIFGSAPIIDADVSYYKYYFTNQSAITGETKQVNIICNPSERTNYQLLFLDRFSSWMPFNFYFESEEQHNINRKVYQKSVVPYVGINPDPYFDVSQRGVTVYNTDIKKSITVSSDWLTDEESEYMMNLLSSPEVYHVESGTGNVFPVIINSGRYTKQENINGLVSYQFSFQYAFDDGVQNF